MRQIFRQELEQVGTDLLEMSALMSTAMGHAADALRESDLQLAQQVIEEDAQIDELERRLDEQCVSLLARQQPVATDLRIVVSALRMSATIERMGDLARHVAIVARGRYPETAATGTMQQILEEMAEAASQVGRRVNRLLDNHDLSLAAELEREDDTLDALHRRTFDVLLDEREQMTRQQIVDSVLLGRYLERFGDHGVSVAHRIGYLVTGDLDGSAALNDVSPTP